MLAQDVLLDNLIRRGAEFYHTINLKDLKTYCGFGGIVPRDRLMTGPYTPLRSDVGDQHRGLLGHVFGNLADFGNAFNYGGWPNIYGPVTIAAGFDPFLAGTDAAITLKPTVDSTYDRARDALDTEDEVNALFTGESWTYQGGWLTAAARSKAEFSSRIPVVPFADCREALVYPMEVDGVSLVEVVNELLEPFGVRADVRGQWDIETRQRSQHLATWVRAMGSELPEPAPEPLRPWFERLDAKQKGRVRAWARLVLPGTIEELAREAA